MLVAAVLGPEQREDRELEVIRLPTEQVADSLELAVRQPEGAMKRLFRYRRQIPESSAAAGRSGQPRGGELGVRASELSRRGMAAPEEDVQVRIEAAKPTELLDGADARRTAFDRPYDVARPDARWPDEYRPFGGRRAQQQLDRDAARRQTRKRLVRWDAITAVAETNRCCPARHLLAARARDAGARVDAVHSDIPAVAAPEMCRREPWDRDRRPDQYQSDDLHLRGYGRDVAPRPSQRGAEVRFTNR